MFTRVISTVIVVLCCLFGTGPADASYVFMKPSDVVTWTTNSVVNVQWTRTDNSSSYDSVANITLAYRGFTLGIYGEILTPVRALNVANNGSTSLFLPNLLDYRNDYYLIISDSNPANTCSRVCSGPFTDITITKSNVYQWISLGVTTWYYSTNRDTIYEIQWTFIGPTSNSVDIDLVGGNPDIGNTISRRSLARNIPNNGSTTITVPSVDFTDTAIMYLEISDSIFGTTQPDSSRTCGLTCQAPYALIIVKSATFLWSRVYVNGELNVPGMIWHFGDSLRLEWTARGPVDQTVDIALVRPPASDAPNVIETFIYYLATNLSTNSAVWEGQLPLIPGTVDTRTGRALVADSNYVLRIGNAAHPEIACGWWCETPVLGLTLANPLPVYVHPTSNNPTNQNQNNTNSNNDNSDPIGQAARTVGMTKAAFYVVVVGGPILLIIFIILTFFRYRDFKRKALVVRTMSEIVVFDQPIDSAKAIERAYKGSSMYLNARSIENIGKLGSSQALNELDERRRSGNASNGIETTKKKDPTKIQQQFTQFTSKFRKAARMDRYATTEDAV